MGLFEGPGADTALRERLEREAAQHGVNVLHDRLRACDPVSADRIPPEQHRPRHPCLGSL